MERQAAFLLGRAQKSAQWTVVWGLYLCVAVGPVLVWGPVLVCGCEYWPMSHGTVGKLGVWF